MLRASLKWGIDDLVKTMTDEQWAVFRANWPGVKKDAVRPTMFYYDHSTQRITLEEGLALESLGVQLDIEGLDGVMLTKMKNRGRSWSWPDNDPTVRDVADGAVVQVTIPDMALLFIDEVTWLEDECTQVLQEKLDEGWRILAVCPPNAQRRPDYILGRRRQKES